FVAEPVGHAVVAVLDVRTVAVWPTRVTSIGPVAPTVLGVPRVNRSAVAVAAPPASSTLPVPTTVAVSNRRPTVSRLVPPLSLTGMVGAMLSQRSQVLNAVVFAQLSPPATSTCVALTAAAAALQREVASVPPVEAHEGVTPSRLQSSNSVKPVAPDLPPATRTWPTPMEVAV